MICFGGWEYEFEVEVSYVFDKNGVEYYVYVVIVGFGLNVNVWYYNDNGEVFEEGEFIVMDYGGFFGY